MEFCFIRERMLQIELHKQLRNRLFRYTCKYAVPSLILSFSVIRAILYNPSRIVGYYGFEVVSSIAPTKRKQKDESMNLHQESY